MIALVPRGTGVGELARAGLAPGLLSAGLGSVPAAQTYLDVSQGNRVFDSLYDEELPADVGGGMCGPAYSPAVVERAESAPADIAPGLLAATLRGAGEGCEVREVGPRRLERLVAGLRGEELLIAIERAPPGESEALAVGIAGRGFDGNLTSASTRTDGYVLSTDVAPTILARLGIPAPDAMSGRPIEAEGGSVDVAAIESLGERMAAISARRGPVIGVSLLAWLSALGLAALAGSARTARRAVQLTGLAVVYLPLALLLAAALEPSQAAERALVLAGAPLLAALTLVALPAFRALAVACGAVVLAHAADVVAGSPLTALSLLGPNPGLGARFYGIGNELEALLAVLVVAGTGAALAGFAPRIAPRRAARTFLAAAVLFAVLFAAGRFGADVGAAIVLPIGGAAAALAVTWPQRGVQRTAPLLILIAFWVVLVLIGLIDLVSGADAHLTRSVLEAGGLGDVAQVAERRLQLSAQSFARPVVLAFLPLVLAFAALAIRHRGRLGSQLGNFPVARAGLLGALAAVLAGTLANDSGALFLEIGAAYLLALTGFAAAIRARPPGAER